MRMLLLILAGALATAASESGSSCSPGAAEYETTITAGKSETHEQWQFSRTTNAVVHQRNERIDRWTRIGANEMALEQIYPQEKIVLEFSNGDLKASRGELTWGVFAHLVDTNIFARLKLAGTTKVLGRKATRFKGELDGAQWEVLWLEELQLPAVIRRKSKSGEIKTVLKQLLRPSELGIAAPDTFRRVDYADLGDLESDPVIQKIVSGQPRNAERHHH